VRLSSVCLAKILSSPEINSLHSFLNPPVCYDCCPCSSSSGCGWGVTARYFHSQCSLLLENLALRQQLAVMKRRHPKPRLGTLDKLFWVCARRFWTAWKQSLMVVTPDTVVRWHRAGFRIYWSLICGVRNRLVERGSRTKFGV
jgi:hypothetical protein